MAQSPFFVGNNPTLNPYIQTDADLSYYKYPDQPFRPEYRQSYNPLNMGTAQSTAGMLNQIGLKDKGLAQFRSEATRSGPSAWAGMANEAQDMATRQGRDQASQQSAGQAAEARSTLAMRGGINSGARERVAKSAMQNSMMANQNISRQDQTNKMQIGMNDEQNRITQLSQLGGMENQANQVDLGKLGAMQNSQQFDTKNAVSEGRDRNLFNMQNYHEQMAAWGANKQANAQAQAGGGGKK